MEFKKADISKFPGIYHVTNDKSRENFVLFDHLV